MVDLPRLLGGMDIYLFDQLVRGRIGPPAVILDAGCGGGRNLRYFLAEGYAVLGADIDGEAIAQVRRLAEGVGLNSAPADFRVEPVESMSFPADCADVVISSAVLHFARDEAHFQAMLRDCWRVLKPGGLFFCRVAGLAGMEGSARPVGQGRYQLPDGSERFLANEGMLRAATSDLGGVLADPLKTTIVHGQRAMMTWVAIRQAAGGTNGIRTSSACRLPHAASRVPHAACRMPPAAVSTELAMLKGLPPRRIRRES